MIEPGKTGPSERHWRILWALTAFLVFVISLQQLSSSLSDIRGSDSSAYVVLAKSISSGNGYSNLNVPGTPAQIQYPPLLPLILSPIVYFLGFNFTAMSLLIIVFGIAAILMVRHVMEEHEKWAALGITLLTGTNFYFLFFMKEILSEVPYAFFSFLAIYSFKRSISENSGVFRIILPASIALAWLTRSIGLVLFIAAAAALFIASFKARSLSGPGAKRLALFAAIFLVPIIIWTARGHFAVAGDLSYGGIFIQNDYYSTDNGTLDPAAFLGRIYQNIEYYFRSIFLVFVPFPLARTITGGALIACYFAVFLPLMAGLAVRLYKTWGFTEIYMLLYFLILSVWPVYGTGDAVRYLVPVVPLLYFFLFSGLALIFRIVMPSGVLRPWVPALGVFVLLFGLNVAGKTELHSPKMAAEKMGRSLRLLGGAVTRVDQVTKESVSHGLFKALAPCYARYIDAAFSLKQMAGLDNVIMTRKPEFVYLITGAKAVRYPFTADKKAVLDYMESKSVSYLLLDECYSETERYVGEVIASNPERFEAAGDPLVVSLRKKK